MSGPRASKRDAFRNFLRPSRTTSPHSASHFRRTSTASSHRSPTARRQPTSSFAESQRILDAALEALSPAQRTTLGKHCISPLQDIRVVVNETCNAASDKKRQCEDKRWRWMYRGRDVILRDEADKVVLWLDRFKSVGDIAANAAPIYAGLPWAGIRMILDAAVSEHSQMAAMLIGMDLTLAIANRLKVYVVFLERLPPSSTAANFEKAVVEMYAHLLRFIASAIETYQKNGLSRLLVSLWQISELEKFETIGDTLGTRAEREANNCDRELRDRNWEEAKQWRIELEASLKRLEAIRTLQSSLDLFHVKVDLGKLATAQGAEYNSLAEDGLAQCLQGTRTELLRQVAHWSDDTQSKCIFWLCGMAGTGKSTICRTVCKYLDQQKRLGASFFFKRGEGDRSGASRFFATIALQLVHHIPGLDQSIAAAISAEYQLQGKSLHEQFEKLLLEPLAKISPASMPSRILIIAIDALDECDRDDHKRNIVGLLARLQAIDTLRLRIFLTSRPELPVRLEFCALASDLHHDIKLEEMQVSTIEGDIRKFFENEFRLLREKDQLLQSYDPLPPHWPGADDTERLV